jgi:hypothetical protein
MDAWDIILRDPIDFSGPLAYQITVAILELVREGIYSDAEAVRSAINVVSSFKGGELGPKCFGCVE